MTAELVAVDLTAIEAEDCLRHIVEGVATTWTWVVKAYSGRAWIALGFDSWDALCDARLNGARLQLPREQRREAVATMREAGLSTRAIGSALSIDDRTVRRDLPTAANAAVVPVTGVNGKTYAPTRPTHEPEPAMDLNEDMWAEAADRLTKDGTVAKWDAERPYALAMTALSRVSNEITGLRFDPAELARNVPPHTTDRLKEITAAHQWLSAFLDASKGQSR